MVAQSRSPTQAGTHGSWLEVRPISTVKTAAMTSTSVGLTRPCSPSCIATVWGAGYGDTLWASISDGDLASISGFDSGDATLLCGYADQDADLVSRPIAIYVPSRAICRA